MPRSRVMGDTLQVLVGTAVLVGGIWFLFKPSDGSSSSPSRRRQVSDADVQSVTEAFPHVSAAAARYELERSGSVQATCEKVLSQGFLPEPPAGYYDTAPAPQPAARPRAPPSAPAASAFGFSSTGYPSLITRFKLQDRIHEDEASMPTSMEKGKGKEGAKPWAASSDDRETTLRQRKEQMILDARRKLLERDRAKGASS